MGFISEGAQLLKLNMSGECQRGQSNTVLSTGLKDSRGWFCRSRDKPWHLPPSQTPSDELRLQTPPHHLSLPELLQQNQERVHPLWGASFTCLPVTCGLFIPRGSPFPDNLSILDNACPGEWSENKKKFRLRNEEQRLLGWRLAEMNLMRTENNNTLTRTPSYSRA